MTETSTGPSTGPLTGTTSESLVVRGDYLSAHFLAEVAPKLLRGPEGLATRWREREQAGGASPLRGLRNLNGPYFAARATLATEPADTTTDTATLGELHGRILDALGFDATPGKVEVVSAGRPCQVPVANAHQGANDGVLAVECAFTTDPDAALGAELRTPVTPDGEDDITTGAKLATWLFGTDDPPRYVLLLCGGMILLADRAAWREGRFPAANLDVALARREPRELEMIAGLFAADALLPSPGGEQPPVAAFADVSRRHAAGVSTELREGVRRSVEIVADEVLARLREHGVTVADIDDPRRFARELSRQSLRYLYRVLFLLYAEARPELRILPTDDPDYVAGYSMARLGDLVVADLVEERTRRGFHLYESLDVLFRSVNRGHAEAAVGDGEGLRFEALRAALFDPERTGYIGRRMLLPDGRALDVDTRLRDAALHRVLRLLMISKGGRGQRGGFISYAKLGINQLGAVYEGLMSYTGFVATEELYEVADNGDPAKGSWVVPASRLADFRDDVRVKAIDADGFATGELKTYPPGTFVYRLAGRDRQATASYYTPESLTGVTVRLALRQRIAEAERAGRPVTASDLLRWRICEPALGSGAFANAAIDRLADEYLSRRQDELGERVPAETFEAERQKVKAYLALHNCYGVDLNDTAVELAEVSIWLNVMHPGLRAPWFGLHLRPGNSLVGAGRRVYPAAAVRDKSWLTTPPEHRPLADGVGDGGGLGDGEIHHFLLPAYGWGAVAGEAEARKLAPEQTKRLAAWRKRLRGKPSQAQVRRLRALAGQVEMLWALVARRVALSDRDAGREVPVWGAAPEDLRPHADGPVDREQIRADLHREGTPYWRLKQVMDAWCALWFWPVTEVGLLDGEDEAYRAGVEVSVVPSAPEPPAESDGEGDDEAAPIVAHQDGLFGDEPEQLVITAPKTRPRGRAATPVARTGRPAPPADLDGWLDFAEALLGTEPVRDGTLPASFDSLASLSDYEDDLPGWTGMEPEPFTIADRFPWLHEVRTLADRHRFFHWELDFANVFQDGGFDLQVGNPPWVQPQWHEDVVLAELDPWFKLADHPPAETWRERKAELLGSRDACRYFLDEMAEQSGMNTFLGSLAVYPLIVGTKPDLYRAFMCEVWDHLGPQGTAGLVHPDTHFSGNKEGTLRAAAYRHLRLHGGFVNVGNWAFEGLSRTLDFGVHIYGAAGPIEFRNLSELYAADVLIDSLEHDGAGDPPGQKRDAVWDRRPHRSRVVHVDRARLGQWNRLSADVGTPIEQTPLLYPVTNVETRAIEALSRVSRRLADHGPMISLGYDEGQAKKLGLVSWSTGYPQRWREAVLQGPHLGIATPIAKQPNDPCRTPRDWSAFDLRLLPTDMIPRTNYTRACQPERFAAAQDVWDGRRYTEYYRVAWRRMIPFNTERSLFPAIIAPGPSHVDAVNSMRVMDNRNTALTAGYWAALPLDYLLRITGRADLRIAEARKMPAPDPDHPLASALLLRTLRLNCLTDAYADLWTELHEAEWQEETWAVPWPHVAPLDGSIGPEWTYDTPLRTEAERRAALVELDALVSVWLGIDIDGLISVYRSRFAVLAGYEADTWFDANGRKIAKNFNTYGHGQTKDDYLALVAHLDEGARPPAGYVPPFTRADREAEYRQAHAFFTARLG